MVFWNMYNRFFLTLKISKNKKQNKKHFFALVSKPNTTKFNSNPQWDQYIQHGGTTPKPTKKPQENSRGPYPQQNWNKPQFTPSLLIQTYSFINYTYMYQCFLISYGCGKIILWINFLMLKWQYSMLERCRRSNTSKEVRHSHNSRDSSMLWWSHGKQGES